MRAAMQAEFSLHGGALSLAKAFGSSPVWSTSEWLGNIVASLLRGRLLQLFRLDALQSRGKYSYHRLEMQ
jgi:hypothetical protein